MSVQNTEKLQIENQRLRLQLAEAQDTLRALRAGEVDAVLMGTESEQVYTLDTADTPYRLLVEQVPQAAASFTTEGVILHGNLRFASLLGRPLAALVGRPIYEFLADESRASFETMLRDVSAAEVRAEVKLRRGDGTLVPAFLSVNALHEGPLGTCLVVTDLTEERNHAELKVAQEALREADRRKNEFVAILAHELRNPLGPIRNAARILQLRGPKDPELRRPIEMIERQTEQLARLLDDLLDVSRITRGAMDVRRAPLTLAKVVEASAEACREELQDRGVHLQVSLPAQAIELVADRARLTQVLCNLITNGAKYTPSGGRVELKASASGGVLTLSVKDNGIGIPADKLKEIFELFAQVDRTGGRSGGLGIGLTLVRQIVTLHGGTIEARSEGLGHGSEFILTLPDATVVADASPSGAGAPAGRTTTPRRVLVVDDNRDAAESLTMLLQIAGHHVQYALDGEEAIALAELMRPDVALLDLGMPKVSGYDVARRIRELPWGKGVYLVALSGWGHADERSRTHDAGFDSHLVKPADPEALNRLLDGVGARVGQSSAA